MITVGPQNGIKQGDPLLSARRFEMLLNVLIELGIVHDIRWRFQVLDHQREGNRPNAEVERLSAEFSLLPWIVRIEEAV